MSDFVNNVIKVIEGLLAGEMSRDAMNAASPGSVSVSSTSSIDLPSFHVEPQTPAGVRESRLAEHMHPELQKRYASFEADFTSETGRALFKTCTWRSKECQFEYFQSGRELRDGEWVVVDKKAIKTKIDGYTIKGRHNVYPAEAVDVAIDVDPGHGKHLSWDPDAYSSFAHLAIKHGLVWGGDWDRNGTSEDESFVDRPHLELPAEAA